MTEPIAPRWSRPAVLAAALTAAVVLANAVAAWAYQREDPGSPLLFLGVVIDTLVAPVIGTLVLRRHPRHVVGWLLVAHGLAAATVLDVDAYVEWPRLSTPGELPGAGWVEVWSDSAWPLLFLPLTLVGFFFPDNRVPDRWRRFVRVTVASFLLAVVSMVLSNQPFEGDLKDLPRPRTPEWLSWLDWLSLPCILVMIAGMVCAVVCLRQRIRVAPPEQRVQLLWVAWGGIAIPLGIATCFLDGLVTGSSGGTLTLLGVVLFGSAVPLSIGAAVLRHRLFDIELVLSRTLVYVSMVVLLAGVYGGTVAVLSQLLPQTAGGLVAAGLVALAAQPAHTRLRRRVEHWVYGDRSDPAGALRRLSQRVDGLVTPEEVADGILSSVLEALRLPWARMHVEGVVAESGRRGTGRVVDVAVDSGVLEVEVPPGRQLSRVDQTLLEDLARQANVVLGAVRLSIELQQSRERIVTAREEERRRLRRDLHDGLGPALAAVGLKLGSVSARVADPEARALVEEARAETRAAIADIRRLVDDLRPPALDEVGLMGALRQQAQRFSRPGSQDSPALVVMLDGPASAPPLPAAVEVAAFRIATEALTNVVKHSGATRAVVTVELDGGLLLSVADNGCGPTQAAAGGVGWGSMRERAAELGGSCTVTARHEGGTVVRAVLPFHGAAAELVPVVELP